MSRAEARTVSVDGHRIKVTNLDKVLYPETGTTKGDVIEYYARIAEFLVPHTTGRAATRKRWVNGVGTAADPGSSFFEKNAPAGTPSWVHTRSLQHEDHKNSYPLIDDAATAVWCAQLAALEIHVPQWRFREGGGAHNPDRLVLDLDPGPGAGLGECVRVATTARDLLADVGLTTFPVTSGSKGIHLYAALDQSYDAEYIRDFAQKLAQSLEGELPDLVVSNMNKQVRGNKVLVDWSQNNWHKTTVAPYSLRGRARPYVACPRTWRELSSASLRQLTYDEVLTRMKRRQDPMRELEDTGASPEHDQLSVYRSKRDPRHTPEPVPRDVPTAGHGRTFVIHEHDASNLHWDFRLERNGVLASWALPKGVPTSPKQNRLAVPTEDHPLEYAAFEGTIPEGEYGAGTVGIWDTGTYDLLKWRDGQEIIVTLHPQARHSQDGGALDGNPTFALINTGDNWLIHLMERPRPSGRAPSIAPMLATLGSIDDIAGDNADDNDSSSQWAFEMKWDGIRAVAVVDADGTRFVSRNDKDLTDTFPELTEPLKAASGGHRMVLDAEIITAGRTSAPSFGRLQHRLGRSGADAVAAFSQVPAQLVVFDLLELDGNKLTSQPYTHRREKLFETVDGAASDAVLVPEAFEGGLRDALDASKTRGLEGVMAKRLTSKYQPGKRARTWVKIKHERDQEVIVAGWRAGNRDIASLLLGVPDDDGIRYIGSVGTGFDRRDIADFKKKFRSRSRKTSPLHSVPASADRDAHWIRPDLVGEVAFSEWTAHGRLRHPRWRGWRPDKSPDDVAAG